MSVILYFLAPRGPQLLFSYFILGNLVDNNLSVFLLEEKPNHINKKVKLRLMLVIIYPVITNICPRVQNQQLIYP